jgi:hypothetical protein
MDPNPAELHEILYLIGGSIGFLLTGAVTILRTGDLAWLYYDFEPTEAAAHQRILAWERLASCVGWMGLNAYMLLVGFMATASPPRPWDIGRMITVSFFFGITAYTTALALFQVWLRARIRRREKADG